MQNLKRVSVVVFLLLALVACPATQKSIVIDTTGLTPEQIVAVEWKVKYAIAIDWYSWQLNSYKANLDLLPKDEALKIHVMIWPLLKAADAAIMTLGALAYAQDPTGDPQLAYNQYFQAKQALLAAIMLAFAD